MERLRCCATRPLREGGEPMLGYEEKLERIELIDAVCDAGRLARGLDQLLGSLAHADRLDPLDVEGIPALRSISERCADRIGDAMRIPEAAERGLLCRGARACSQRRPSKGSAPLSAGNPSRCLLAPPLRFRQAPGIGAPLISLAR